MHKGRGSWERLKWKAEPESEDMGVFVLPHLTLGISHMEENFLLVLKKTYIGFILFFSIDKSTELHYPL